MISIQRSLNFFPRSLSLLEGSSHAMELIGKTRTLAARLHRPPSAAILSFQEVLSPFTSLLNKSLLESRIEVSRYRLEASKEALEEQIQGLNHDLSIDGIFLDPQVFEKIDREAAKWITPKKNIGGQGPYHSFCPIPEALEALFKTYSITINRRHVAVVSKDEKFLEAFEERFSKRGGALTLVPTGTIDPIRYMHDADLLIVDVGIPQSIKRGMVKEGAEVVDLGLHKLDGRIVGDVDFIDLVPRASKMTPPGRGVEPLTAAVIARRVFEASQSFQEKG